VCILATIAGFSSTTAASLPNEVSTMWATLFPGFERRDVATDDDVRIHAIVGGDGPPLLLLHGHPQTHAIWHKVAPVLAQRFTLVLADLRGYGDSSKPAGEADHANYSKRTMARDMLSVMRELGHERFAVMAHDRGARVTHRLAADHADAVQRIVVLDIAPTLAMYEQTNQDFARAYSFSSSRRRFPSG
jgi:haloacetate dehalogenase